MFPLEVVVPVAVAAAADELGELAAEETAATATAVLERDVCTAAVVATGVDE